VPPPRSHVPPPSEDTEWPWVRHPGNGFSIGFGAFLGGSDLATANYSDGSSNTLSGGSGVLLEVGLMLTPLWAGDTAGFGLDAFAGLKYDSVGDSSSSISLLRYPVGLGAHTLLRVGDRWWLMLRGGILKETGVTLSASGYPDASLTGSLGGFGEGGIFYVCEGLAGHPAFVVTFRYSATNDSANGASISARSGGLIMAFYFSY
jgi:hypothetical protein